MVSAVWHKACIRDLFVVFCRLTPSYWNVAAFQVPTRIVHRRWPSRLIPREVIPDHLGKRPLQISAPSMLYLTTSCSLVRVTCREESVSYSRRSAAFVSWRTARNEFQASGDGRQSLGADGLLHWLLYYIQRGAWLHITYASSQQEVSVPFECGGRAHVWALSRTWNVLLRTISAVLDLTTTRTNLPSSFIFQSICTPANLSFTPLCLHSRLLLQEWVTSESRRPATRLSRNSVTVEQEKRVMPNLDRARPICSLNIHSRHNWP